MADLITLAELRSALGVDPTDTRDDTQYLTLIPMASDLIRTYTGRDFGSPSVTEARLYRYDGSGVVDVDDAATITDVAISWPSGGVADVQLDAADWWALPDRDDDSLVYQYIEMPGYYGAAGYGSPEMGFTRNLDVYARERGRPRSAAYVKVTGDFGWPVVPPAIKLATIWTLQEWLSRPSGESISSEAIEGWSRTWGGKAGAAAMAIPPRVRDILASYDRVVV